MIMYAYFLEHPPSDFWEWGLAFNPYPGPTDPIDPLPRSSFSIQGIRFGTLSSWKVR